MLDKVKLGVIMKLYQGKPKGDKKMKIGSKVRVIETYEMNEYGFRIHKGLVGVVVDKYHWPFVLVEYEYLSPVDGKIHKTHTWIPLTNLEVIN